MKLNLKVIKGSNKAMSPGMYMGFYILSNQKITSAELKIMPYERVFAACPVTGEYKVRCGKEQFMSIIPKSDFIRYLIDNNVKE